MSDGTVLAIALVLVTLASLGLWWLWHQRRSQRPTPLKKGLMVVAALTCLLLVSSASAGFRWLWLERRGRPVTSDDLRILTRVNEILRDESVWNRQDDRQCDDDRRDFHGPGGQFVGTDAGPHQQGNGDGGVEPQCAR